MKIVRSLGSHALLLEAKRRRAMGDYSRATLGLYAQAWSKARTPQTLLQFCLFRHELGYRLPDLLDQSLQEALPRLPGVHRQIAEALRCRTRRTNQNVLRAEFDSWLCSASVRTIAVVGNSADLLRSRRADDIEAANCVVRFNHWKADADDVGRRTDVWIRSPLDMGANESPAPHPAPNWIAVTGPEMDARKPEWDTWSALHRRRLLSVPLRVWRSLVRNLVAPPSAGVLTLAWLRSIRETWDGIEVFGMGYSGGRYHAAKKSHRPSHRHRWELETHLLRRWASEGLTVHRVK